MIAPVCRIALVVCLLASGWAGAQAPSLEARVAAIETANTHAPWRESAALIDALLAEKPVLSDSQRYRVDLVRARNQALSGDYASALAILKDLLGHDAEPSLRLRALTLSINCSANTSDYATAFTQLKEALGLLDEGDTRQASVLGMASYLYVRVGEEGKALDFAQRDVESARQSGNQRDLCTALSGYAVSLDKIGHAPQAEAARREQVEACSAAGDPVFTADGYKGIGFSLLRQGHAKGALPWLARAEAEFAKSGFATGLLETKVFRAEALLRSNGPLAEASDLLQGALQNFEAQEAWDNVEPIQRMLSEVAEKEGRPADALKHLRQADAARARLDEDARKRRLAYLQVEFDTEAKNHQINALENERARTQAEIEKRTRAESRQRLALLTTWIVSALLLALLWRTGLQRRRYRLASEIDGLTGLYDHQSTLKHGNLLLARARHEHKPFTAVVADIDHFKQINDRHGHAAGDAVLTALGDLLRQTFPKPCVIGRSGGEEFTILLDADAERTRKRIETLRARIQSVAVLGRTVDYSLSFGLSAARDSDTPLEEILRSADMALYQAKRNGRDQVVDAAAAPDARATRKGGLVVVGSGIQLGRHLSPRCLSEIEEAECVFALTDGAAHAMLLELRPDLIDLRHHYAAGKDRRETYREMDAAIMAEVLAGRRVCAVFYGHPGVFADVPHAIIRKARAAGINARMEPGISSEACLYADLGIDPGRHGVQSLEATQFLIEERRIDPRSLLVLWQVALVGDVECTRFHAEPVELERLVERLRADYPENHEVILYEAARLPIERFRAERLLLRDLAAAHYEEFTTLVIPPVEAAARSVDDVAIGDPGVVVST